ncbi:MAG: hypothetical protein V9H26_13185 [Verrucomicrobiota bacterium]
MQAGDCILDASLIATQSVLWVDAFFLESGLTNLPIVPTNVASSLLYFSSTDGILALDGDGSGRRKIRTDRAHFPDQCLCPRDHPERLCEQTLRRVG